MVAVDILLGHTSLDDADSLSDAVRSFLVAGMGPEHWFEFEALVVGAVVLV